MIDSSAQPVFCEKTLPKSLMLCTKERYIAGSRGCQEPDALHERALAYSLLLLGVTYARLVKG